MSAAAPRSPLTVYALRRDGFTNEITLTLADAPQGFRLTGAKVPANQDQVRLTLQAPPAATDEPVRLSLEGRAFIQGQPIAHPAVPAEDMMQAFAYRHLVPAKELDVDRVRTLHEPDAAEDPQRHAGQDSCGRNRSRSRQRARRRVGKPVPAGAKRTAGGHRPGKVSPVSEGTEIELRSDAAKSQARP